MDVRVHHGLLIGALAVGSAAPLAAQNGALPDSLPPGVDQAMVAKGRSIFLGPGLCLACHGPDGKGALGPDLTDTKWLHHDGSFDALVAQITKGVDLENSKTGQMMPPRGGSGISDADVRAVAAYVWTLSRKPRK